MRRKLMLLAVFTLLFNHSTADTGFKQMTYRELWPMVEVEANMSAYTDSPDEGCIGITSNGNKPEVGIVANDVAPAGSIIEYEEDGQTVTKVVDDKFGGDYGIERIDIFMLTKAEAWKFGRQHKKVKIYLAQN